MIPKELVWFVQALQTPPAGPAARREAGFLIRLLQQGERLSLPESRPMRSIGRRVHELRIEDAAMGLTWRIIYRIDDDAILIVDWFHKKTKTTSKADIARSRDRLSKYDAARKRTRK
jgi:phage-related protein